MDDGGDKSREAWGTISSGEVEVVFGRRDLYDQSIQPSPRGTLDSTKRLTFSM